MATYLEFIRESALNKCGLSQYYHDNTPAEVRSDIAEKIGLADKCLRLAKNRLKMGTYRYGVSNHDKYDYRQRLQVKLFAYDQTGNKEFLVDAINYCILEFGWPSRIETYFAADDTGKYSNRGFD